jgi:hypothetical protein
MGLDRPLEPSLNKAFVEYLNQVERTAPFDSQHRPHVEGYRCPICRHGFVVTESRRARRWKFVQGRYALALSIRFGVWSLRSAVNTSSANVIPGGPCCLGRPSCLSFGSSPHIAKIEYIEFDDCILSSADTGAVLTR